MAFKCVGFVIAVLAVSVLTGTGVDFSQKEGLGTSKDDVVRVISTPIPAHFDEEYRLGLVGPERSFLSSSVALMMTAGVPGSVRPPEYETPLQC